MNFSTGIDIVEVFRIRDSIRRYGKSFLEKVFTEKEIDYAKSRRISNQHLAARFAAKEAVVKAFGEARTFPVNWNEIEVVNDSEGKPAIRFHGDVKRLMKKKRIGEVIISMSHSKHYAIAHALLFKKR